MIRYLEYAAFLFCGWVLGGPLIPLYRALVWRMRRLANEQECEHRATAKHINATYGDLGIKRRLSQ